jgi:hypothetical protein
MRVKWKPLPVQEPDGTFKMYGAHRLNAEPTTLQRISQMPAGKVISLQDACSLFHIQIMETLEEGGVDAVMAPEYADWIGWIARQGFQILLKGDEYEVLGAAA